MRCDDFVISQLFSTFRFHSFFKIHLFFIFTQFLTCQQLKIVLQFFRHLNENKF